MTEEFFDIINESGKPVGQVCPRSVVHRWGYLHATAHIWIVNQRKEILLQKRSLTKETHPGLWDISCAGHLSAGDTPLDAAVRECYEELGLIIDCTSLRFLFTIQQKYFFHDNLIQDWELASVFLFQPDHDLQIKLSSDEVDEVKFVDIETFNHMVESADPQLVPHDEEYRNIINLIPTLS